MNILHQNLSSSKVERLVRKVIFADRKKCPHCHRSWHIKWLIKERRYWCRYCRKKFSFKSVCWLKHSKLPWKKLVVLIYCWQNKFSPSDTEIVIKISHKTVIRYYRKLRRYVPKDKNQLEGLIEMDEMFCGKRKNDNQVIACGAYDRTTKQVVIEQIPDREQATLEKFLEINILPASLIHTDAHSSYFDIEWMGYGHKIYNHDQGNFSGTAHIESIWSVIKRLIRRMYFRIYKRFFAEYLNEFQARNNHPEWFKNPFEYLKISLTAVPTGIL